MIASAKEFIAQLEKQFPGLHVPIYKFRRAFDENKKVFFDADGSQSEASLDLLLSRQDLKSFVVFLLIKTNDGNLRVLDVSFSNLGSETLNKFMNRFPNQLEPTLRMSQVAEGSELVRVIGFSYKE
jgi:hypothetical protein